MRPLFGFEHEYSLHPVDTSPAEMATACQRLMRHVTRRVAFLHDRTAGIFLESGARFYIDCGAHPEWCTPECDDPTELVHQVRAGEAILRSMLAELSGPVLLRTNTDAIMQTTWGSHDSHYHRGPRAALFRTLIPHVVSRVIFSGAGGLAVDHPGIVFVPSPRLALLARRFGLGGELTSLLARHEPHAGDGSFRCHIPLGDTLCLDHPLWLRAATTALVVAVGDARGEQTADVPMPQSAAETLRIFASDPMLRAAVLMRDGRRLTALEMQRALLRHVERHLDGAAAPDWAAEACRQWSGTLEKLEQGAAAVTTTCDWALKQAMFNREIARAGFDPEDIPSLNAELAARIGTSTNSDPDDADGRPPAFATDLDRARTRRARRDMEPLFARFLALRDRLLEIDMRFGQFPGGIVEQIAPMLADAAPPGVTAAGVARARRFPPRSTRAWVRGGCVRRFHRHATVVSCDWSQVIDRARERWLNLSDPFNLHPRWEPLPAAVRVAARINLGAMSDLYNEGDYGRLRSMIRRVLAVSGGPAPASAAVLPYLAWVQSRTGDADAAARTLDAYALYCADPELPLKRLDLQRFRGLAPSLAALAPLVERCEAAGPGAWEPSARIAYLAHRGYMHRLAGRMDEAVASLRQSIAIPVTAPNHLRLLARSRCELAECYRVLGRFGDAGREAKQALRVFREHGHLGELAEFALPALARVRPGHPCAVRLLKRSADMLRRLRRPVGAVRALLLRARVTTSQAEAEACRALVEIARRRLPDLRTCPQLERILSRWHDWACARPAPGPGETYWLI
jgi:hypothetical protein